VSRSVSASVRRQVAKRANSQCEYCLLSERFSLYSFHIEHIKSIKHGGTNDANNLAYCCPDCNYFKGSDIGTYLPDGESLIRFFNPRSDRWDEHFELVDGLIEGVTEVGAATTRIFKFNDVDRLIFRQQLIELGLYP
jgi:hypothetical protein